MERVRSRAFWVVALIVCLLPRSGGAANLPERRAGTAFAAARDGYLVTCAHVVADSARIEVQVGEELRPARLLGTDPTADLAVLKVDRPVVPLPLADSDTAEVGEELRVLGYPLTGSNGTSLKVTRGVLSGIEREASETQFLTDAVVRQGNSGGPVLNERGQVVGVVRSRIPEPSGLAFAAPGNRVLALLHRYGATVEPASGGEKLEGTALVKRAAPSVLPVWSTPKGSPMAKAEPGQVEKELEQIRTAGAVPFPAPVAAMVPAKGEGDVEWEIKNETDAPLSIILSGPERRIVNIPAGDTAAVTLPPGQYEVAARVGKPGTAPLLGQHQLAPGVKYRSRFYFTQQ